MLDPEIVRKKIASPALLFRVCFIVWGKIYMCPVYCQVVCRCFPNLPGDEGSVISLS